MNRKNSTRRAEQFHRKGESQEAFEMSRRVRFPASILKIIVEDHDAATRPRGSHHLFDGPCRLTDPLERPCGRDDIEGPFLSRFQNRA